MMVDSALAALARLSAERSQGPRAEHSEAGLLLLAEILQSEKVWGLKTSLRILWHSS